MFCGLEQIELTVSTCPVKCMYKTAAKTCGYSELTDDHVDVKVVSVVKGQKLYKTKTAAQSSERLIKIGLAIDRYSDFVRSSFPRQERMRSKKLIQRDGVVNEIDSHVRKVLRKVFGLADNQQLEFWSEQRYNAWSSRTGTAFTLHDIRESLADIKL